jgi:hypothetical protein
MTALLLETSYLHGTPARATAKGANTTAQEEGKGILKSIQGNSYFHKELQAFDIRLFALNDFVEDVLFAAVTMC